MGSAFFVNYSLLGWNGNGTLLNYGLGQEQTTSEGKVSDTFTRQPASGRFIRTDSACSEFTPDHRVRRFPSSTLASTGVAGAGCREIS